MVSVAASSPWMNFHPLSRSWREDKWWLLPKHWASRNAATQHPSYFWCVSVRQQDSASAHCALSAAETTEFIPPEHWPPNPPDLNPDDCSVCRGNSPWTRRWRAEIALGAQWWNIRFATKHPCDKTPSDKTPLWQNLTWYTIPRTTKHVHVIPFIWLINGLCCRTNRGSSSIFVY